MQAQVKALRNPAKPLGPALALVAVGLIAVVIAVGLDTSRYLHGEFVPYCLGALYLAAVAWAEATRRTSDSGLPTWLSPPALIAGWTLLWIYGPAAAAFFDEQLFDELAIAQGGPSLLTSGMLLGCIAVTTLWCSYRATHRVLGAGRTTLRLQPRYAALHAILLLFALSVAARALRVSVAGIAFGAQFSSWGEFAAVDQWVGYVEDLRYLALALLVAHVVRNGSGRVWLAAALAIEVLFAGGSGFIKPLIWPVVVCVATAAALDRLRGRHVAAVVAASVFVASFMNVVMVIREDSRGGIGAAGTPALSSAIAASVSESQGTAAAVESAYRKFFGRQTEVAASTGLVVALTPSVFPFEGLQQFVMLPTKIVPRALWPDKPILSRGEWFSTNYRGLEEDSTSSAMTMFGEGYLFYGWTGVCLGMMLVGGVLAVLYRAFNRVSFLPVYLALLPTMLEIEPELSSYLTTLVQRSIVFIVVFYLFSRRSVPMRPSRIPTA
jgi:hypothetical protein